MITGNAASIQAVLDALTPAEKAINELQYYKKDLQSPSHSSALCSSVRSAISMLDGDHAALVQSLLIYGSLYGSVDSQIASSIDPAGNYSAPAGDFTYTHAPEHQKGFFEKTLNQIVLGDFSDDVTWLGTGANLVLAFLGLDAPMDARDAAANASKGEWGWAALNVLSLLPVIGVFTKGGKIAIKAVDGTAEVLDAGGTTIKAIDKASDVFDASSTTIKSFDAMTEVLDSGATIVRQSDGLSEAMAAIVRNGDEISGVYRINGVVYKNIDGVFSGVENIDELAVVYKQGDNLLWETSTGRKYVLTGDNFAVYDKAGNLISNNAGVSYLPDFTYIKKSDELHTKLRKEFNDTQRTAFLQDLYKNNRDDLKKLGLTDAEIEGVAKGELPPGRFQVHHKLPLDDGGDNSFGNLILISNEDHEIFTYYQNTFTRTAAFKTNNYDVRDWVIPEGKVYINKPVADDLYCNWSD